MKELKNLERTNFNWFGVKEQKNKEDLSEEQIKETMKFTFAPFIPYWIYSFLRSNWDFLLLRYLAVVIFYIIYMVFYFGFVFSSLMNISKIESSEFPMEMMSKGLILIGVAVVLFLIILFGAEIAECFFARRLSWNRLAWKDFESYEYSERQWNIAGLVFLGIRILGILAVIVMVIIMIKFIPNIQEFKDLFHV